MSLDQLMQMGLAPVLGSIITILAGINTVFFRWLIYSFKELRNDIKLNEVATLKIDVENKHMMSTHEERDQERHEENLYRFEKIAVALARMGSTNGSKDYDRKKTSD